VSTAHGTHLPVSRERPGSIYSYYGYWCVIEHEWVRKNTGISIAPIAETHWATRTLLASDTRLRSLTVAMPEAGNFLESLAPYHMTDLVCYEHITCKLFVFMDDILYFFHIWSIRLDDERPKWWASSILVRPLLKCEHHSKACVLLMASWPRPYFKHLLSLRNCLLEVKKNMMKIIHSLGSTKHITCQLHTKKRNFCYTNVQHTIIQNKSTQRNFGAHSCIITGYRSKWSVRKLLAGIVSNVRFLVYKTWIQQLFSTICCLISSVY
jgi:hypothetical protein